MIKLFRVLLEVFLAVFNEVASAKQRKIKEQTRSAIVANPRRAVHEHFGGMPKQSASDSTGEVQPDSASDRAD